MAGAVMSSALVLSACNLYKSGSNTATGDSTQNQTQQQSTSQVSDAVTITLDESGFSPATSNVNSDGSVTWTNSSEKNGGIASDPHPTHTSNQELTDGQFVLNLAPGASATVTVTKKGTWGFHDHLNPSAKGSVTVN
ncbi:hypothetical protein A2870_01450 [Candidatus Curtissbacteria bacterium RIFCSPHIGHO2_01_FULL_41_11]|uniref:EfeO-type cupredoxin-like domain-containing protein n=1 Tax=Candidatus Curtissbacteria bacterium RIFCSPHIGHO2_01_FULL_41_11 TaxID=1797711 RepID=A0A1F5G696_9BACT|nr:MAG: hypothetical protein A2870_01450 [Candidatus Curtissbacteria bacterium RIFCSPHIGHO2_01_FULL_41_11]